MFAIDCPIPNATLECYPLEKPSPAVIICPGGGYWFCSPREAEPIARAYNNRGFSAFVLEYECRTHPLKNLPLSQLAWAVSHVRQNWRGLCALPDYIAVCGFSAGAHLACSLGVYWNERDFCGCADINLQKPNAMLLCYPVVSSGVFTHGGSMQNLTGGDIVLLERFSLEKHVTADTPPAFLWHTLDDGDVPVENSLLLLAALKQAGVAAEAHFYPHGVHGLSLATPEVDEPSENRLSDPHIATWHKLSCEFLQHVTANALSAVVTDSPVLYAPDGIEN